METIQRGNGATTNYFYDEKSRLLQLTTTDASNSAIQNSTYGYYPDNTIAWKQDETGTGAAYRKTRYDYEYDGLDRIVKANGAYSFGENANARTFTQDYAYTLTGNITTKRTQESATKPLGETYSYAYNNHAVSTIDSSVTPNRFEFRYDASGNMTYSRDGTKARNISFDSNNRIAKVTDDKTGEVQGEYAYDEQGFRIRKTAKAMTGTDDPSVRVDLIYPSMYFALERKVTVKGQEIPDTAYAINNIYLNGVRIAATKANGEAKYYLTDQVDSVSLVADDDAHVETRTEYMPFGETWFQEGDSVNKSKYNSQELDRETNFYYYNARHYDPEIARFVTADTVIDGEGSTLGWNRYSYCRNNPIIYRDPTGHDARDSIWSVADAVGEKIRSVGEGIRNVGEKVTQTLRDAGDWVKSKLDGGLQNKANGSGNRIQLSGDKIRDEMINNYKEHSWTDKTGKTTTWSDTTIGGVKVNMNNVSKQDIGNTSNKTLETLNNMIKGNNLSEMTIERLYRGVKGQGPHGEGLGADITQVKSGKDVANFNKESGQGETKLAEKVTKWAMDNNNNISQVLTPWHMNYDTSSSSKGVSNKWNQGSSDTSSQDYQHRNRLHMTIK
jgi:RHS repeat-associated protein